MGGGGNYIGGYDAPVLNSNCPLRKFAKTYELKWNKEERDKINTIGGGFLIYNLAKMRQDNIESKFLEYCENNIDRLLQPEQDVINMVCYPHIKKLSKNGMVSTYFWSNFDIDEKKNNASWSKEDIEYALNYPIQVHYAGVKKPWKDFNIIKWQEWCIILAQTNYFSQWVDSIYKYKEMFDKYKGGDLYVKFKTIIPFAPIFEFAKKRGIFRIRILNLKLYIDFSMFRKAKNK
ncbi:MAG: hypothetical protein K2P17_02085 [Helicobacteraceae bacterium]|nr:hypothetical protein [Helicobacteraceae bacterium]